MSVTKKGNVQDYVDQPYNIIVRAIHDEAGSYYVANVLEFDGCIATGDTKEEAYESVYEVLEGFIEDMLEDGDPIPEPVGDETFSGNLRVRLPKSLHRQLSQSAKIEGISLNQYLINKLSK